MRTSVLTICLFFSLFFFQTSIAQVNFVKGYFVDNLNRKTECLIKNLDWRNNPTEFDYKLDENSPQLTRDLTTTNEFGVNNVFQYKKFKVKIDKTSDDVNEITQSKLPVYVNETLFLKTVIEGETSLYEYNSSKTPTCFFSQDKNGNIEQLIYKKYLVDDINSAYYELYKQQLKLLFEGTNITDEEINKTKYSAKDLSKLFARYSSLTVSNSFEQNKTKSLFNVYLRPGVNFTNFSLSNSEIGSSSKFDPATSLRVGIELEYILPINNNKWGITFEPTYNAFKTETDFVYINGPVIRKTTHFELDYKSVLLPLGFRYYMFLNKKSKLFLNAGVVYDINSSSSLINETGAFDLKVETNISLSGGIGYNYNNIVSIEAKYESRKIINYAYWGSSFNNFGVIVGYNILSGLRKKK